MPTTSSIAPFYKGWHLFNENLIEVIAPLTAEQLALPIGKPEWPVWASVSHLAGTRVYWLCQIFKEPGAETTPFKDPTGFGWEDDLTHPRSAQELVHALESTWRIVERTLATWTPEMLGKEMPRPVGGKVQLHTRQSVLIRMMTHDAFHSGEISLVLGNNGLGSLEPWRGLSRIAE
jgi:uncharacterized damage-inducible protein DinB